MLTCIKHRVLGSVIVLVLFCLTVVSAYGLDKDKAAVATDVSDGVSVDKINDHAMAMKMKGMMRKEIVATSDGGIVILSGCKLVKYDSSLNLVKEVELTCGNVCPSKGAAKEENSPVCARDKAKGKNKDK